MALQRFTTRLDLARGSLVCVLEFILRGIQRAPRLTNLLKLEDCLDFFGAFCWLDQNETQDFPTGERNLWVICDLIKRSFHVGIGGHNLWLARKPSGLSSLIFPEME